MRFVSETERVLRSMLKLPSVSSGWRANSGGRQGRVRLLPSGFPDLFGRFRDGVCWYIEVKSYPDKLRPEQEKFLDSAEHDGCFCACVYSDSQAARAVVDWLVLGDHEARSRYRWRRYHDVFREQAAVMAKRSVM